MRLFLGLPIAHSAVTELAAWTRNLQSAEDGLRWMPPESWHITLDFLGTTRPEQYTCVVSGLRKLHHAAVSIEFDDLSFFDRAEVFVVKVKLTQELAALQKAVAAVSGQCQFSPEERPYQPHVTLARSKSRSLRTLKAKTSHLPTLDVFTADSFALYESFPGPTGSEYKIRETFSLSIPGPSEHNPQGPRPD